MAGRIALCIDEMTMSNPDLIGLDGEPIGLQPWLDVYANGDEARRRIAESPDTEEAWIVSCEDIEPINLAASLKSDNPALRVSLISFELCGSLLSRAHNAQIDEVIEHSAFVRRYGSAKRQALESGEALSLPGVPRSGPAAVHQGEGSPAAPMVGEGATPSPVIDESAPAEAAPAEFASAEPASAGTAPAGAPLAGSAPAGMAPAGMVPAGASLAGSAPAGAPLAVPKSVEDGSSAPLVARTLKVEAQPHPLAMSASSRSFVISVVSGSGGAGKSAVSALSALVARASGHKTLLLDCDLQFGDVDVMVGVENPLRFDEALSHPDLLEREAAQEGRVSVLAAPARLEAADEVARYLPELLERVSETFDVVVVNTGASWAEQHAVLLERSSVALFLVDQRASSVRACKHALELCARCGIATGPFQFALNRCAKGAALTSVDVSCALQGAPVFELKDGGRDVEDYLSSGSAAELLEMRNEFAKSIEHMMKKLLPGGVIETEARVVSEPSRRLRRRRRKRK